MNSRKSIVLAGLANLFAAFGGGAVLGKGINVISLSFIQLGSLVAFFLGTALGLFILYGVLKGRGRGADIWIAVLGSLSSVGLFCLYLFGQNSDGTIGGGIGILFFLLLCVRFSFWFLSRVLRSDRFSLSSVRAIPFIEGLFHSGTIISLGLISADLLPWKGLASILLVDGLAQGVAGGLDFIGLRRLNTSLKPVSEENGKAPVRYQRQKAKFWMAVVVFCLATVWCQVVLFHFAHLLPRFGTDILAAFYLSVAVIGLIGAKAGIQWVNQKGLFSKIHFGEAPGYGVSSFAVIVISVICVLLLLWNDMLISYYFAVLLLVFLAGFFYEFFSFGILNYISNLGKELKVDRVVAKSFGYIAVASTLSMVTLRYFEWTFDISSVLVLILFVVQIGLMFFLNRPSDGN